MRANHAPTLLPSAASSRSTPWKNHQATPGASGMLLGEQVVDLVQAGVFTPERLDRWWAAMDEAVNAGHFTGGGTAFIVSGTVQ